MDRGKYKKLNSYHVVFLVHSTMAGLGGISLSHDLSPMGYNQWFMMFIFGFVANITLIPMICLGLKYPQDNLFRINEILLGKWLGKGINVILAFYGILMVSSISYGYLNLLQTNVLINREFTIPLIMLLLVMVYIVSGGIKLVARFCIIAFFLSFWMLISSWRPFVSGTITHIFPLFNFTLKEAVTAFHGGYRSFLGYGLIMVYFPYIIHQKKALKHASIGIWIAVALYLVGVLSNIAYLSLWQMENLNYPTLAVLKSVELSFIERVENILVAFWVFMILSTTAAYLWASKKGIDVILGKVKTWHLYIGVVIIMILLFSSFPTKVENFLLEELPIYLAYGAILWPAFLLIIHKIRSLGGNKV